MGKTEIERDFIEMIRDNEAIIFKVTSFYANQRNSLSDIYQEIVINLWKAYPSFRGESRQSTWIYRIALNTCVSFYRRKRGKPVFVDINYDIPDITENNDALKELYRLVNRLDNIERALILLYLEDKPYKEISEITGLSVTNVATKLSRIKEKLKKMSNGKN